MTLFVKTAGGDRALRAQADALRAFGAHRAVGVIDVRPGELVLERLHPGIPLTSLATEDEAMQVVARLLADGRWPRPAGACVEPIAGFARALNLPDARLARAAAMMRELIADAAPAVLLHGDLHYGNVLSSNRAAGGYLLADPKGAAGEAAFDAGYLVSRPMPRGRDALPLEVAIDRRLAFLPGALGLDRKRVAAYAYVAAALSLAWAIEDADGSCGAFAEARRLLERMT